MLVWLVVSDIAFTLASMIAVLALTAVLYVATADGIAVPASAFLVTYQSELCNKLPAYQIDFLSNGFKVRTNNAQMNHSSYDPYIYGAWGDVPFKYQNSI